MIKARKWLEYLSDKYINNTLHCCVHFYLTFVNCVWSVIQRMQSEGCKIYKLWRFKWKRKERTCQQMTFDKFCSSCRGKWKGYEMDKSDMAKNTAIYFLWEFKAQNFLLLSQMQSVSIYLWLTEEIPNVKERVCLYYFVILAWAFLILKSISVTVV